MTRPGDRLRVAIAGAGMVARHHAIAWGRVEDAVVCGIADSAAARAAALAREHGGVASYDDVARMLDEAAPDALDIAAAHDAHGALCRLAADRGIPFLCQKPLASTLPEARAIARDVGQRVRWAIHENWRFRPWYRAIAKRIEDGAVGDLLRIDIAARGSGLLPDAGGARPALARQPMLAHIPRLALGEVGVHHLDVATWIAGPCEVEAAALKRAVDAVRGESCARVELRSREGVRVTLEVDLAAPGAPSRIADTVAIEGTRATMRFDGRRLVGGGPSLEFDPEEGYQASYDGAIASFASALRTGAPFETPAEAHLGVLELVEDAYRLAGRD